MIRKTKIHNIVILNNLITDGNIKIIRKYIDSSLMIKEEETPNLFLNISDPECNNILQNAQASLKLYIENEFQCHVSDEGIGTVVQFVPGWELPYHCDQWSNLPTYGGGLKRDISSIIYLSDDFNGGQLEFPDLNIYIEPCAGSAIFFTGTEDYMHRVSPIISGTRLICTSFWSTILPYEHVRPSENSTIQV